MALLFFGRPRVEEPAVSSFSGGSIEEGIDMIIVLRPGATDAEIDHVIQRITELGFRSEERRVGKECRL